MHSSSDHSDVQNPSSELFDLGLRSECSLSRRDQVWRLPDEYQWGFDERLFLYDLKSESKPFLSLGLKMAHTI
jgi:hypothetical protein